MSVLSKLLETKIVAIFRGFQPLDLIPLSEALYIGGIRNVEITLNSADALSLIKQMSRHFNGRMQIGAGTVLDAVSAQQAIDAGAQYIISPNVDIETIRCAKVNNVVSIPGAYTPSEIVTAHKAGADIIKLFPAAGLQYFKDVRAPLSDIPLMPTGGINVENIREFLDAGAVAFGIGSALASPKIQITDDYLQEIENKAAAFVNAITT